MYVSLPPPPNPLPATVSEFLPVYPVYYFTVFPHLSSGLDPVALLAPQMYSGLVVLYAGMLGLLLFLERDKLEFRAPVLILAAALTLAATTRFRIHFALAVLPAFLLITLHLWRRKHQSVFLLAGFGAAVVAGAVFILTRTPVYFRSSGVHFGL